MALRSCLIVLLGLMIVTAGCGEKPNPSGQSGGVAAQPSKQVTTPAKSNGDTGVEIEELGMGDDVKIVLEAESGTIEAPMQVYTDAKPPTGTDGPRGASGGKYCETAEPPTVDPASGKQKELHGGSTTLTFDAPHDGKYYLWLRVWWRHGCANALNVQLDSNPRDTVGDNTCARWHWVAIGKTIFDPAPLDLKSGRHTLKVTSREDGSVVDQVLLVDDPDYRPAGAETSE